MSERPLVVPVQEWSRGTAIVLSLFVPGLGQLYKGQVFNGIAWFVVVVIGYFCLVLPGLVLHLFCLIGAASGDNIRYVATPSSTQEDQADYVKCPECAEPVRREAKKCKHCGSALIPG